MNQDNEYVWIPDDEYHDQDLRAPELICSAECYRCDITLPLTIVHWYPTTIKRIRAYAIDADHVVCKACRDDYQRSHA